MTTEQTLQSIADVLAEHEAAYHPGQLCPEDQHGRCAVRPRPVPSPEDRMRDARTDTPPTTDPAPTHPGRSFRTWMSDTDRDQLDARAACAEAERDEALDDLQDARRQIAELTAKLEDRRVRLRDADNDLLNVRGILSPNACPQRVPVDLVPTVAPAVRWLADRVDTLTAERDEALDDRDVLRAQLDTAREDAYRDIARQIDILAADPGILRDWLTTCDPQPVSFGELFHALAEKLRRPTPPSSVPPRRAQEEPASEEVRWAYRWIGTDGRVYDEMDASDNAIETGEQRAHRIAAKRLTGTVRGEVVRYRVLTMPAEVVATYPPEARP